jgi:DNA-binding NarL/FixJ family response regulator
MVAKRRVAENQRELFPATSKRIMIVDDHELLRSGLRLLLDKESDFEVCGEAADVAEAKRLFRRLRPDVLLVDLKLRESSGLDLIKHVKEQIPTTRVLVCSMHDEKIYGERVLRAGASGYVNKYDAASIIVPAIRQVLNGKLFFGEELINRVMMRAMGESDSVAKSPVDLLSDRELEVFRMIGAGLSTRDIAKQLHLSPSTVDTYRERLKSKLTLKTAAELIHQATQWVMENE